MFSSFSTFSKIVIGATATYSLWSLWKLYNKDKNNKNVFLIHRDIDPNCNGKPLSVGVSMRNDKNPKKRQGIRWGDDGEIKSFISFSHINHQRMTYHFEDSTVLTIYKGINHHVSTVTHSDHIENVEKVMYNFTSPETGEINKEIDENYFGTLKSLSMGEASGDLDEMFSDL